jgi:predicted Na+-dependent transporter
LDLATLIALMVRVFLVVTMLSIGLRLVDDRSASRAITPATIVVIVIANLILVPIVGIAMAAVAGLSGAVAIAVLATTVAPAGSLGPKLVQIARGDLAYGIWLTFALSVIATLTVGPTLELGGRLLGIDPQASPIDARSVILNLAAFLLLPTLVGLATARRSPALAGRIVRPLTRASTSLIVIIVVVAVLDTYDDVVLIGPTAVAAMVVIVMAANLIGWASGGSDGTTRRASAIVTGQRSPGLALLLVAGPGHAMETATVVAFTLVLLVVNGTIAIALGRAWAPILAHRRNRWFTT